MPKPPSRGEVWYANFSPMVGREQAGDRPGLVVSADRLNRSPAQLVIAVPLTTTEREVPWHIRIEVPDGGLRATSYAQCENVRSISKQRLRRRLGTVHPETLRKVEDRLRILLAM